MANAKNIVLLCEDDPQEQFVSECLARMGVCNLKHRMERINASHKSPFYSSAPAPRRAAAAFYALPADDTGNSAKGAGRAAAATGDAAGADVAGMEGEGPGETGGTGETGGAEEAVEAATSGASGEAGGGECEVAAPWTLTLRRPCPGRVLAVPDVADLGEVAVETSDGVAAPLAIFAAAANAGADGAEDAAELRLALPDGVFTAQLWDGAGTLLKAQEAEGTFDFALAASGVWHSLVILDADGEEVFSIWLRAE